MVYYPKYPFKVQVGGYQVPPIYIQTYYDHFIRPQYYSPFFAWQYANYRPDIR
ncbi:hypothetical protein SAMN04488577_2356 [Bacillus sp. cl95]|nr:hypothetical protein SAMN02799634_102237 [Bacillus sp. UNCCL13]SFQ84280.1 hypothetical protein SAMN04488577_2356 [Bacillus sp. cl95]